VELLYTYAILLYPIPALSFLTASNSPGSPNTPTPLRSSCFLSPRYFAQVSAAPPASERVYACMASLDPLPVRSPQVLAVPVIHILANFCWVSPFLRTVSISGLVALIVGTTASLATETGQAPFWASCEFISLEIIPRSTLPERASTIPFPAPPAETSTLTSGCSFLNSSPQTTASGYKAKAPERLIVPPSFPFSISLDDDLPPQPLSRLIRVAESAKNKADVIK